VLSREIGGRITKLRAEVQILQVIIDQSRREHEVSQIVDSEFFVDVHGVVGRQVRRMQVERHAEREAAMSRGAESDARGDAGRRCIQVPAAGHAQQGGFETGGVADGEKLLGIGARPAVAARNGRDWPFISRVRSSGTLVATKSMTTEVTGIAHIALRVTDLPRAKRFYTEQLGWLLVRETDRACIVSIGGTTLVLIAGTEQTRAEDRFDPFRVGLDHLALTVSAIDLPALKQRLDAAGVRNNGIEHDNRSGADSITFYDPDDIAWEFYASPR